MDSCLTRERIEFRGKFLVALPSCRYFKLHFGNDLHFAGTFARLQESFEVTLDVTCGGNKAMKMQNSNSTR